MDQRLSIVTLGVDDLDRAVAFYGRLGWRGRVVSETAFFQAGSIAVVLWSRALLAADCGLSDPGGGDPDRFGGIALAHNVASREAVDELCSAAESAGATVTRSPAETFYGGYAGVFRDPDGHCWEVAHNPGIALDEEGALVLPEELLPEVDQAD